MISFPSSSARSGKSSGYAETRWKCDGATRKVRDSRAMWTSVACQASLSSAVEATYTSMPDSYSEKRASGM
jgi:hypothetical protein